MDCWVHTLIKYQTNIHVVFSIIPCCLLIYIYTLSRTFTPPLSLSHTHLPTAPVASAIVLAVAEFWHTDNKTAARWITERAAEIETLKG